MLLWTRVHFLIHCIYLRGRPHKFEIYVDNEVISGSWKQVYYGSLAGV